MLLLLGLRGNLVVRALNDWCWPSYQGHGVWHVTGLALALDLLGLHVACKAAYRVRLVLL